MTALDLPDRFYKHLSTSGALAVLKNTTLRWSHPRNYNDQFEVPDSILSRVDAQQIYPVLSSRIASLIEDPSGAPENLRGEVRLILAGMLMLTPEERKKVMKEAETDFNAERAEFWLSSFRDLWRQEHDSTRILCLTDRCDSESMWDRYSEGSKGAVLEFEPSAERDSQFLEARAVEYVSNLGYTCDTPEGLTDLMLLDPRSATLRIFQEYIFTKTDKWVGENEWRLILWGKDHELKDPDYTDIGFNPEDLRSVIFGSAAENSFVESVRNEASRYPNVGFFEMSPNTSERRFERHKLIPN